MSKMLVEQLIQDLQNLTKQRITQKDLGDALGISKQAIGNKKADNYEFAEYEINKIKDYVISKYSDNKCTLVDNSDSVTLDYYPDVFGSCGTGYFVSSEEKEQIQVPINALFKQLSKGKKYSVINAQGTSMMPYIEPGDKLIIEHLENQPIVDNHVYVFCYDKDLYIKRLYKNIDEIIAKSDNPDPIFKVKSIPKEEWNNLQLIGEIVGLMRDLR